ncbi:cardiolipin synthase [Glaciimonas immobilis]|uniref:Cardiolipin synthase n=1 Tax=Glaciimonas immobilis TaxID=728004 RepID=A0A840RVH1_9BURK|nr:cardiolipin synthase [Glaciimonas immobilis]KAF3995923.1 cardiolipin synthase [Glaciimonas immobilis]MBB5202627.1 cardiolipin synthase [Glaciimonas immobilis]
MQYVPLELVSAAVLLLHIAGVVAAAHALMHTRTSQGAVAWVFGLVLLPYFTLLPYLFLGSKHFTGYVELHHSRMARRRRLDDPEQIALTAQFPPHPAAQRYAAISAMLGVPFLSGHQMALLINGEATFKAIFAAIAAAEHYVLVQFFIIKDDPLGRRLQAALMERARAGVKVYLLYDGVGCHDLPGSYCNDLRASGVQVHPFASRRWRNRFQLNFRNHRKVVVVDGWRGFVGGLNVGEEYLGNKPPLSPWRDTHMALQGPAVSDLQLAFDENWHWITGQQLPLLPPRVTDGQATSLIAATGPADAQETCSLFFIQLINAAQKRIWLTTPYLVPDSALIAAMQLAVFRGVDVRILLPSRPDHRTVFLASTLYAHEAVRAGIRVFRYKPGFTHQKVMLIDDDTTVIGSMNLDNRSLRLNFEIAALTIDTAFATEVEAMLRDDFTLTKEIELQDYIHTPYLTRVLMHVARLFGPVL